MRKSILWLASTMLFAGCPERSAIGFSGSSPSSRGSVSTSAVDDPSGAANVTSAGSRPTVTLLFEINAIGAVSSRITGQDRVSAQVFVDSALSPVLVITDSIPVGNFTQVRVTLVSATLVIPNDPASPINMLGGSTAQIVERGITLTVAGNATSGVILDLNSAGWLVPVSNPSPDQPAFVYSGTTAFVNSITVRAS